MNIEPTPPTGKGPAEWFTGDVWIEQIVAPKVDGQRGNLGRVRFAPGARTAWHSHDLGQTLHITEGTALLGTRDGQVIEARPGDTVYTPPGEEHWHGAAPDAFMEHLAAYDTSVDPPLGVHWHEHVSESDYRRRT
ncbi:MAG: cupin domain-containing protein [Microbacteriaceae bacterium]|nr:cupin domain-containing protein [Microbacteriaceae bacterium]